MTPAILYLLITFLVTLSAYGAYLWGKDRGAAAERIKLYGNTLPRFENPPPPPKYKEEPLDEVSGKYNFSQPLQWCTPVTRIEEQDKKQGVPTMPNHPPVPLSKLWSRDEVGDGQWVPVDEYIPDAETQLVMIYAPNLYGTKGFGYGFVKEDSREWYMVGDDDERLSHTPCLYVSHWRPLPDPPKEKNASVPDSVHRY